jgi:EAL domain-containing protein (putative c-di-GMP-specific phosphodiesterase class I)
MANGLRVGALAEGIETPGQLSLLRRYGCDQGQGFLLGRPVTASEMAALLRRGRLAIARGMITAEAS